MHYFRAIRDDHTVLYDTELGRYSVAVGLRTCIHVRYTVGRSIRAEVTLRMAAMRLATALRRGVTTRAPQLPVQLYSAQRMLCSRPAGFLQTDKHMFPDHVLEEDKTGFPPGLPHTRETDVHSSGDDFLVRGSRQYSPHMPRGDGGGCALLLGCDHYHHALPPPLQVLLPFLIPSPVSGTAAARALRALLG